MSVRGRRSVLRGVLALLAATSWLAACGETITQVTADDIVELVVASDSLGVPTGRTVPLVVQALDSTGSLLVGQVIGFESGDASVATVDENGLVTGVAAGATWVVATAAGLRDSTHVTVAPPPLLVLSDESVTFSGTAGGTDPGDATVGITNGGAFPLVGLAVDSIAYASGTEGWLTAELDTPNAPATLTLSATLTGVTTAGAYDASVWLSGVDADGSPATVTVTLAVQPGSAGSMSANGGDGQSATVDTQVATPPSVLVLDGFDNPVPGAEVDFAITAGGGSLTGTPATTDAEGIATVGSWTLGTGAGPNEVSATLGGLPPVIFTATGEPGPPADLTIAGGDGQSAIGGSEVPESPSVKVADAHGNAVEGVGVTFEVVVGGGTADGADQTTGADGIATVGGWTLGTTEGQNTLRATAAGVATPVTFTATALDSDAVALLLIDGDTQQDTVAATLTEPYVVRVVDGVGNGVADIPVTWQVTGGGGSITSPSTTDAGGYATAVRILGTSPGAQTAEAEVGGLGPVAFSATALVGSADHAEFVEGGGQTATVGTQVAVPPRVRVVDVFDNPIAGHSVTFEVTDGGGTVDPVTAITTDGDGLATVVSWTLGIGAGTAVNELQATGTGLTPVTITASGTPDAAASISVDAGDGQTAVSGTNVTTAPNLLVVDQHGNPVPDVDVLFTTSGGEVGTTLVATNASGAATTTWAPSAQGGTMQADGVFPDTLFATVANTALTASVTASVVYSYGSHVNGMWQASGCTGCHGGATPFLGLALDSPSPSVNRTALVTDAPPVCDAALTTYRRVNTAGGDGGFALSVLRILMQPTGSDVVGTCGPHNFAKISAADLAIVEAWIRNGAPDN